MTFVEAIAECLERGCNWRCWADPLRLPERWYFQHGTNLEARFLIGPDPQALIEGNGALGVKLHEWLRAVHAYEAEAALLP